MLVDEKIIVHFFILLIWHLLENQISNTFNSAVCYPPLFSVTRLVAVCVAILCEKGRDHNIYIYIKCLLKREGKRLQASSCWNNKKQENVASLLKEDSTVWQSRPPTVQPRARQCSTRLPARLVNSWVTHCFRPPSWHVQAENKTCNKVVWQKKKKSCSVSTFFAAISVGLRRASAQLQVLII